jgi:DnaJ-class molecular chaperone
MDYYDILGIKKSASQDEIRTAYKKMSMKHHPDRGGDESTFKEVNQAYQTLSDPERKQMYDQYGTDDPQKMGGMGGNPFGNSPFGFSGGGFDDMFSSMFGQGFRNQVRRNRDIQIITDINLEDAFNGKNIPLNYRTSSGRMENVTVDIPLGIQAGQTVRYKGLGDDAIPNAPRGDLLIKVRIKKHHVWERNGNDLYGTIPVSVFDLMLGTVLEVQMLDGKKINLTIPPGTKANAKFNVPGHGMKDRGNVNRGKAILIVEAIIPNITDKKVLADLANIRSYLNWNST